MLSVEDFAVNDSKTSRDLERLPLSKKKSFLSRKRIIESLSLALLLTTIAFFATFLVYYLKFLKKDDNAECNTLECIKTASIVATKMNISVNPCEDFDKFACGNFYKTAHMDEDETVTSVLSRIVEETSYLLKDILEEEIKEDDYDYVVNMKNLYKSCMDEESLEEIGTKPYNNTPQYKEWPTLIGEDWPSEETFDLNDVITRYMEVAIEPIFSYDIGPDPMNTSRNIIELAEPGLGLSREFLLLPRNESIVQAYERYYTQVAIALGADALVAHKDAAEFVKLERQFAQIKASRDESKITGDRYNPTTLAELGTTYSYIDIPRGIRAAFALVNITVEDDFVVNVDFPEFYEKLESILQNADKRTVMNKIGFAYALRQTRGSTKRLRDIRLDFVQKVTGMFGAQQRWEICQDQVASVFPMPLAKEYTRKRFSEDSKEYVTTMVGNIERAFRGQLRDAAWMGESTRSEAYAKLDKMTLKIGYPDTQFSHKELEEYHKNLTMSADNNYENMETVFWTFYLRKLKELHKPVDKARWHMAPFETNAYYSISDNEIVLLAGLIQPPLYSKEFPDSLNYGALGSMVGHEITHGFDDEGRLFDQDGTFRDWWDKEDMQRFKTKSDCFVEQYNKFRDERVGMNVSGFNTLGENVADNGGLESSYNAYKELVGKKGAGRRLPGLDLTHDQLFFLGYAQTHCEKATKQSALLDLMFDQHSPDRFRTLGTLQNSPDFAKAYNCPLDSTMNPEKKCSVW